MPFLSKSRQSIRLSRPTPSRYLQDSSTSTCSNQRSMATTLNDDPAVPVYAGVMFGLASNTAITINGLDVDVRLDMITEPQDLDVQVYTVPGEIADSYMDPSVWTLLANTTAVVAPELNGVIIPAEAFTPLSVNPGERHTFYISMTKSIIDSTVYALDKTEEVAFEGADLTTYVGVGFTTPNFPGAYDTTVDPQFAGTIYYEPADGSDCSASTSILTTIYFDFLFSKQVTALGNVNSIVTKTVDQLMEDTPQLQQYRALDSLKVSSITTTPTEYTGGCPEAWDSCTSFYQSTAVVLSHLSKLSSEELMYEMYKTAGNVTTAIQAGIKTANVFYIGLESISAEYEITMDGVPAGVDMDDIQSAFFSGMTSNFLALGEQATTLPVYVVSISQQQPSRRRGLRSLQTSALGTNVVTGQLRGAKYHYLLASDYLANLKSEFDSNYQLYMDKLKYDGLRPGLINQDNRYTYFSNMTTVSSFVTFNEATVAPQETFPDVEANGTSSSGGGLDSALIAVIAAAGGVIVLIIGCLVFSRLRKINRETAKLRDDESDSVVFESLGSKQAKQSRREPEFSVEEKPQRRRSFDGATKMGSLDNFISQRKVKDNKLSGARSVEELPLSKRGHNAAGMAPSSIEHVRRTGQKRPQNGGSTNGSLSTFMDQQPKASKHYMSGSRSVGPGAVPDPSQRQQVRQNSAKASEQSLLDNFMKQQPKQTLSYRSGARSVEERPVSQRSPAPPKAQALGGFLDGQSRQHDKKSGSRSVDGDAVRRGGRRPGKIRLDDYMDGQSEPKSNHMSGSRSVGPGIEPTRELTPEEKWGPLPKPPSMKRLNRSPVPEMSTAPRAQPTTVNSYHTEPTRGVRRAKSMDSSSHFDRNGAQAAAPTQRAPPTTTDKEPTRGVRRAKSMDDASDFGKPDRNGVQKKKKPPPLATTGRSNSFDDGPNAKTKRHRGIRLDSL